MKTQGKRMKIFLRIVEQLATASIDLLVDAQEMLIDAFLEKNRHIFHKTKTKSISADYRLFIDKKTPKTYH
jgi:hypothetical protein